MIAAITQVFRRKNERRPQLAAVVRKVEILRHDTDDGEAAAIECHGLADDVLRAAEAPLPEAMFEHRDILMSRFALFALKGAAHHCPHSKRIEETCRHRSSR